MKIIEEYLKKDLKRNDLASWQDIRRAYMERGYEIVNNDWQSPSYLSSLENQAGRREGKIIGNINDYTRDQHDLSLAYEKKFVKEYLPWIGLLPIEAFVTSSGMAGLTTAITALHELHGVGGCVLVGKHSYFQNIELISKSFAKVILFDEMDIEEILALIQSEQPLAIFIDSMCNESNLSVPSAEKIAKLLKENTTRQTYLVIDNSMLAIGLPWKKILKYRSRKVEIIGWESLNKYYQFGLDRTTGGIVWGAGRLRATLFRARINAGTIIPDINVAMLPTPSRNMLELYLARIEGNRKILKQVLGQRAIEAQTNYDFSGAQVVVRFNKKVSYEAIQRIINRIIQKAKKESVQIAAGTSFGMATTRIYLTARKTKYAEMFLRISVGVEESSVINKISLLIKDMI